MHWLLFEGGGRYIQRRDTVKKCAMGLRFAVTGKTDFLRRMFVDVYLTLQTKISYRNLQLAQLSSPVRRRRLRTEKAGYRDRSLLLKRRVDNPIKVEEKKKKKNANLIN